MRDQTERPFELYSLRVNNWKIDALYYDKPNNKENRNEWFINKVIDIRERYRDDYQKPKKSGRDYKDF